MRVVLAKDYPSLGFVGDNVQVKRGFARNFLLPQGIAVEARSRNARQLEHTLSAINAKKKKLKAEAQERAEKLKDLNIEIKLKVGVGGKSFGSIGTRDLEAVLQGMGEEISRKQILLADPIKTVGEFPVPVKLHSDLNGEILVKVIAEKLIEKTEKPAGKKRKAASDEDTEDNVEGLTEEELEVSESGNLEVTADEEETEG